jgi:hypothetical protein
VLASELEAEYCSRLRAELNNELAAVQISELAAEHCYGLTVELNNELAA